VAAVIPVFNGEAFVNDAVASVQGQIHPVDEIVIVDDGSTDGTPGLLARLARDDDAIRIISQPNRGEASARNAGVAAATCDLIAFLDADDTWHPSKLERQLPLLLANPDVCLTFSGYAWTDGTRERFVGVEGWEDSSAAAFRRLTSSCCITPSTVVARRSELLDVPFEERLYVSTDWITWLRLALTDHRMVYVPESLTVYRWHGENMSRDARRTAETALVIFRLVFDEIGPHHPFRGLRRPVLARWHAIAAEEALTAGLPKRSLGHLGRMMLLRPRSLRPGLVVIGLRALFAALGTGTARPPHDSVSSVDRGLD
jgi:glycosyltransferase involved in cell wall biosynthesis